MNKWILALWIMPLFFSVTAQKKFDNDNIYLIIRADDIGSSHAANIGCMESYQKGISRSVELMPPCSWFPEAVKMLNENPGYDVGIHLTLTSEWSCYKWRPVSHCPSLVGEDGFFFPMVWENANFPPNSSIQESDWKIEEIEQELRAQIELSLRHVPHISHLTTHMGFASLDPKIEEVVNKLAGEYDLEVNLEKFERFPGWDRDAKPEKRIDQFCENLKKLTPGRYLFVEHPARDFEEMKPIGHTGSNNVAESREWVTRIFTSEKVKQTIREKGIKLISYADVKE